MAQPAPVRGTRCPLCTGDETGRIYRLDRIGLEVFACAGCGLKFVANVDGSDTQALYAWPVLADYTVNLTARYQHKFKRRVAELAELVPPGSRILDVGCGGGDFCHVAAAAGFRPVGIDVSEPSIALARRRYPELQFELAEVEDFARVHDGEFDAVTSWDVLEHVLDPHAIVRGSRAALRDGGVLLLATPNGESVYDRIAHVAYRVSTRTGAVLLVQRYSLWHLQIWTRPTMRRLLREHHLAIVREERQRELSAPPSLYAGQVGFGRLAASLRSVDAIAERLWPIRNKLVVAARKIEEASKGR